MTTLESKVLEAINDLMEMFPGANTIESATLIENAEDYELNSKQVRAILVTLAEKNIIELQKFNGVQHITVK